VDIGDGGGRNRLNDPKAARPTQTTHGNEAAWVATFLLVLAVATAAGYVPLLLLHASWRSSAAALAVGFGARETCVLLAVAFALRRYLGLTLRDLGVVRPRRTEVAIGLVAGFALILISMLIARLIPERGSGIVAVAATGSTGARVAAMFVIALWSPFVQEVLFRGALLRALRERLPDSPSVLLSAGVFGLVHAGSGPASILSAGVVGVVLAALTIRYGTLTAAIVAHIVVNGAACVWLILWLAHLL
jgi:hypothetical protein